MDQGSIYGDFDAEEEIARILLIEIEKEIAANGSVTWAEFCEKDKLGRQFNGKTSGSNPEVVGSIPTRSAKTVKLGLYKYNYLF